MEIYYRTQSHVSASALTSPVEDLPLQRLLTIPWNPQPWLPVALVPCLAPGGHDDGLPPSLLHCLSVVLIEPADGTRSSSRPWGD